MAETESNGATPSDDGFRVSGPELSLPKGGGAIRGIGEKFTTTAVSGTGSMSLPLYVSPGRSGFGPQLALSYDSGAANSAFGFGWNLALPSVTRKTDKGLPRYLDTEESDIFILSGAEDLTPALVYHQDTWTRDVSRRRVYGKEYEIHRYRPRVEGLFARIERWSNVREPQDTFWRSISRDNVTSWYGLTPESRVADPADPGRIFSWLICESYDDHGNGMVYQYKPEDSTGVDLSQAHERNRTPFSRSSQRYIKHIFYGNRTPYFPDLTAPAPIPHPTDWCFQVVFDYGEHDLEAPVSDESGQAWHCRRDPFSTYRSCFEVRTYRLCRRVLMFHHFADEPNVGLNCLVRSTDLQHASADTHDPTQPFYSYLLSATQRGYVRRSADSYLVKSLPPVEFEYTRAEIDSTVREADAQSVENLPEGLDGSRYRWVDLDGEGISGVLTEQGGSWYYKPNLSAANQHIVAGEELTLPRFGATELVARRPVVPPLSKEARLMDLSGDGKLDIVTLESASPGFYERTDHNSWRAFRAFRSLPNLNWRNPNLNFVDLTGDGFPDLLISEDAAFWWYPSLAEEGFGPPRRVPQALDEEKGPHLVFADSTESIFLADLSGDGLTDLVRIRQHEIAYWPNLGYGRFGAKVTMDAAPVFDTPDGFDARRIRLADIDGSGTTDILYLAGTAVHVYFNSSGNSYGARRTLEFFPKIESLSSASVLDLLGNGTACLVWSSPLPSNAGKPLRYIDLMGGQKPHLLVRSRNNLGAETVVHYAPSTRFYIADKLAGTPWLTRVPFPVHVVERVETYDYINRNRFVTRYGYHHGYYDGVEREFRGFGRVDQWDTDEIGKLSGTPQAADNLNPSFSVPPVWTRTWYHTGAYFGEDRVSRHLESEYYSEGDTSDAVAGLTREQIQSMLLEDTVLPRTVLLSDGSRVPWRLSTEELREACRALRGMILRQEVYGLDGSERADRPYSASERNYTIEVLQPQGPNRYGVFTAHPRESLDVHYERTLYRVANGALVEPGSHSPDARTAADPRVSHAITLAVDAYNNVLQTVSIGYGRRYRNPKLTPDDQARQQALMATCIETDYTNAVSRDDTHRTPLAAETRTYELLQLHPDTHHQGVTNLLRFHELRRKLAQAADGAHEIAFESLHPSGLKKGQVYRRPIKRTRVYYRPDDLGASAGDVRKLLPLGRLETLALPGASYKLALTPGLIKHVYRRAGAALLPDVAQVLGSTSGDGGGYVDLDHDGSWWIASGRSYYLPTPSSPAEEWVEARRHFFLSRRFEDPFGNTTAANYDSYDLLVTRTIDAARNEVSALADYRVLAAVEMTDPNGNRQTARLDALGLVVGTAIMGKTSERLGDSVEDFQADLTQEQIDEFFEASDPHTVAAPLLGSASTRVVYDVSRFYDSRCAAPNDPSKWLPVFAATLLRETHVSDLRPGEHSAIQIAFGYSDGFGREIQRKVQCEPGPVTDQGPVVHSRWAGTGWKVYNNKGKPVREFEPFFTDTHDFEFGVSVGVSPVMFYDPAERVVATLHPNHSYDKVVFDPWQKTAYDTNDTVAPRNRQTGDPRTDPDIRGITSRYFEGLGADAPEWQTWYAPRASGEIGEQEQHAAQKARAHADTPDTGHFDTLGRPFLKIARNRVVCAGHPLDGTESESATRLDLDIEGHQLCARDAVTEGQDPLGRIIVRYFYDLLGRRIYQLSMESNARWMLMDAAGKPVRAWDSRGHNSSTVYDAMRRPVAQYVRGTSAESDPRLLHGDVLVEKVEYGEETPHARDLNLRTRVYRHFDSAGLVTNAHLAPGGRPLEAYDFKGNLLRSSRRFTCDYAGIPDWSETPRLEEETFESASRYDALNRPIQLIAPRSSLPRSRYNVLQPTFNESNMLERVDVWLAQDAEPGTLLNPDTEPPSPVGVANIDYDAKGQRQRIDYKNGVTTHYTYDPTTFRLVHLLSRRSPHDFPNDCPHPPPSGWPGCQLQNLRYTYDPVGNLVHVQDNAQQRIFFNNRRVEPSNDFTFDALYQLIEATGREHLGQGGLPMPHSSQETGRVGHFSPNDGNAMGRYLERYVYDAVGNFLEMQHRGADPAQSGWTREYAYAESSLIEDGKTNNRLSRTTLNPGGDQPQPEIYQYDAHGNTVRLPQLGAGSSGSNMDWDYRDQLRHVDLGGGGSAFYVYDSSGQRVRKVCERSRGLSEERLYLAGFEIYRKRRGGSGETHLTLERESLHVMDDRSRIALVETRTLDTRTEDQAPARLIRYQVSNQINSSIVELDEHAQIISYEEYAPYGSSTYQAVRSRTDTPKRYRFTGKERDEESGLYYHGARYFAPWLGRWTACDPGGFRDGPNLYAYISCNPINSSDPTGRHEEPGHGGLIYRLALAAGWPEKDAAQIALASAGIDHDPAREPTTAPHIFNGITVQWHFLDKAQALNHVETDIKGGLKTEQAVTDFGEHLHTLADVGFKDAAGPHTRGNGPGILNIGVAVVLFILLIAAAVVGALAIGFGGGGIAAGIFSGVVLGVHGVGDFFALNEVFAGAFGLGSFGHPWRKTEHGGQSTPVSHVADELYQDPTANTREFTKIYDLLEQGAKAKYGSGVVSNRQMAMDAIAKAVNASTAPDILNVLAERGTTPSGQKVQKSYLEWVESESVTSPGRSPFATVWHGEKVPWNLGDVDITVDNDAYQISRDPQTQAYQIKKK